MKRKVVIQLIKKPLEGFPANTETALYGSEACGEAHDTSYIDLLIIADKYKTSVSEEQAITQPLYEIEPDSGIIISPKVVLRRDWENRPFATPFQINILNEGILP